MSSMEITNNLKYEIKIQYAVSQLNIIKLKLIKLNQHTDKVLIGFFPK